MDVPLVKEWVPVCWWMDTIYGFGEKWMQMYCSTATGGRCMTGSGWATYAAVRRSSSGGAASNAEGQLLSTMYHTCAVSC